MKVGFSSVFADLFLREALDAESIFVFHFSIFLEGEGCSINLNINTRFHSPLRNSSFGGGWNFENDKTTRPELLKLNEEKQIEWLTAKSKKLEEN